MFLLGTCVLAGASIVSIRAYEGWGTAGMVVMGCAFAGMGAGVVVFAKQIGMMEVWAKSYKEADVKIGLKDLERQQAKVDEETAGPADDGAGDEAAVRAG